MSKKTQNIHKSIDSLFEIQNQLEELAKNIGSKEVDDLSFNMSQQLKNLKFYIESLYKYNGKSTSNAKKNSSRENGKKGGRPPKAVTEAKRRIAEINDVLIPELEEKKHSTIDFVEEQILQQKIQTLQLEADELLEKLGK